MRSSILPTTTTFSSSSHALVPASTGLEITEQASVAPDLHDFRPPNGATRSPCPALNSLANHSYLPHDGHNVTFTTLFSSLREGFGLSRGLSLFLTLGTFALLRLLSLAAFDLHECARHNYIEHDASMVHNDTPPGEKYAPTEVDDGLLESFLTKSHPSTNDEEEIITMDDIVEGRIERETVCAPIDALHAELARGEFAMVMEIFGNGCNKELRRHDMEVFLGENRFPVNRAPRRVLHLRDVLARRKMMKQSMRKLKGLAGKV